MTKLELQEIAYRAVAADLAKMLFDQPDITARVGAPDTQYAHRVIRNTVEHLHEELIAYADDEGVDLRLGD